MNNKYKQKIIMVLTIIILMSMNTNVLAETVIGQQTISNKGTFYKVHTTDGLIGDVYIDGAEGGTWHRNHDLSKPLPITVSHNIPLPKGTTGSKLSFKEDDIRGYGKVGNVFDNGHSNVKTGSDMLDKTDG